MAPNSNNIDTSSNNKIPTVDLKDLYNIPFHSESTEIQEIAAEFGNVLHQWGFAYITNHGISANLISEAFEASNKFFQLPTDVKLKYAKKSIVQNYHGYTQVGREVLNAENLLELRESYDIYKNNRYYPDEEVPEFQVAIETLETACRDLDIKLLKLLAMAVKLDDVDFFVKASVNLQDRTVESLNTFRTLYYPPIDESLSGQKLIRCNEHSDYGIITLLFQQSMGGLEVKSANNEWSRADPIPNTIVVNIGDLLEAWTAKYFPATPHRVLVPETELQQKSPRQSMAFFLHPDDHIEVSPLKSDVIPQDYEFTPVNSYTYAMNKAKKSYGY